MQTNVKEAGWIGTQESITLSEQLPGTRVTTFSPTSLF